MAHKAFLFLALLCSGLSAGSAYTTWFWFKPGAEGASAWFEELKYAVPRIGVPLFVLQPVALLAALGSAILAGNEASRACLGLGALAFLVAGLVTRIGHIPINQRALTWKPGELPPDAGALQQRWFQLHVVRTVLLHLGVIGIIAGALTATP